MGLGDNMATQCVNLTYLLDTSGSMYGERINQLNVAMSEAVQIAEETGIEMEAKVLMRVIEFNSSVNWLYGDANTGVEHIDWKPLSSNGGTNTAGAIEKACEIMHTSILGIRNYQPVVILVTDGESNDPPATIQAAEKLKNSLKSKSDPSKDKIIRIAIGVQGANRTELEAFASRGIIEDANGEKKADVPFVFEVDDINMIKSIIKNVTLSSIASSMAQGDEGGGQPSLVIPDPNPGEGGWVI